MDTDDLKIVFTKHVWPTYTHSNDLLVVFSSFSFSNNDGNKK